MSSWSLTWHLVWNSIHEEGMKMFALRSSFSPSCRQVGLCSEPVANLRIGNEIFGRGSVVAKLLSQLSNKSTKILQLAAIFRSPDGCQNAGVRKRKAGVRHQKMKQL